NPSLRHYALFVCVLDLAHLGHGVSDLDNCRMSISPGQDNVHHFRFALQSLHYLGGIEHAVTDGVIDLIQDNQVPGAGMDCLGSLRPGLFYHADIFGIGLFGPNFHEAAAHLLHDELIAKSLHRIELAIVPRALQKLQHQDAHALPHRPQSGSHGSGGLALARAGIHDDETTADVRHTGESTIVPVSGHVGASVPLVRLTNHVGTAALGCPAERSSAIFRVGNAQVELRSTGQPGAAVPTRPFLATSEMQNKKCTGGDARAPSVIFSELSGKLRLTAFR